MNVRLDYATAAVFRYNHRQTTCINSELSRRAAHRPSGLDLQFNDRAVIYWNISLLKLYCFGIHVSIFGSSANELRLVCVCKGTLAVEW